MGKNWLKRFEGWATALSSKLRIDLFAIARFKIAFGYALIGLLILAVGGYVAYSYLIFIIRDIISIVQELIQSPSAVTTGAGTNIITESINGDLVKMSVAVGIWVVFTMIISAYILAEIILWPIRRAVERQKRFIADISHELRTPLSVMKTNAEIAMMDPQKVERAELLGVIRSNLEEIDRMSRITQFLLTFSNIEHQLGQVDLVVTNMSDAVAKAVNQMETIAAAKGVLLTFARPDTPLKINGNATAIGELTTNLLKNAITYTDQGGSVCVTLAKGGFRDQGGSVLSVSDSGAGIPAKDLPSVFEPFYRAENAVRAQKDAHSGLGLSIVKEIADLHKASISVNSELGKGTRISLRFPPLS